MKTWVFGSPLKGYSPTEIAKLYYFPTSVSGVGETVGILELGGGFRPAELQQYFQNIGINPPPRVGEGTHPVGGQNRPGTDPEDPRNSDSEVMLDIEVVGAIAPGAEIVVYFSKDATDKGFLDCLTAAIHDPAHRLNVISISWGGAESETTDQFRHSFNQTLETARALGITVCVSAGDDGSADFPFNDPQRPWDGNTHVDFPASSPLVLACGGTRLSLGSGGSLSEVVWHTHKNVGTGGGVSRVFERPAYQVGGNVPRAKNPDGPGRRGVPDVSGNAAQESGYRVLCDGKTFTVGGTSAVSPLWAGLVALLNGPGRWRFLWAGCERGRPTVASADPSPVVALAGLAPDFPPHVSNR